MKMSNRSTSQSLVPMATASFVKLDFHLFSGILWPKTLTYPNVDDAISPKNVLQNQQISSLSVEKRNKRGLSAQLSRNWIRK